MANNLQVYRENFLISNCVGIHMGLHGDMSATLVCILHHHLAQC